MVRETFTIPGSKKQFLDIIQSSCGLDNLQQSEEAVKIVLHLLSHRITFDEALDAHAQLPKYVRELWIEQATCQVLKTCQVSSGEQLTYHNNRELLEILVSELEKRNIDTDPELLFEQVCTLLKLMLSEGEIDDIASQLPKDIRDVWCSA